MRLVVDTNIVFAALLKDSTCRRLLTHLNIDLLTIEFSEEEISKYKKQILKKAKINEIGFHLILDKLYDKLIMIDDNLIKSEMKTAIKIMDKIDLSDTQFIAAALATNSDIWTDDKHFEKQNKIKIWKTKDLIKFI